jgi:hypothetical protein
VYPRSAHNNALAFHYFWSFRDVVSYSHFFEPNSTPIPTKCRPEPSTNHRFRSCAESLCDGEGSAPLQLRVSQPTRSSPQALHATPIFSLCRSGANFLSSPCLSVSVVGVTCPRRDTIPNAAPASKAESFIVIGFRTQIHPPLSDPCHPC